MVTTLLVRLRVLFETLTLGPIMTVKHYLDLDFYYDGPRPQSTPEVEITLLQEEGPAGGNPVYRLVGTLPELEAWLTVNYCTEGSEPVAFYLGLARPVWLSGGNMDQGQHQAPPPIAWASDALRDVAAERRRQIEVEGWTPDHDDGHRDCEMAAAAATYAICEQPSQLQVCGVPLWPWPLHWWKPTTYRQNLVKAGALILAEIERLDRRR